MRASVRRDRVRLDGLRLEADHPPAVEDRPQVLQIGGVHGFVERHADGVGADRAQVDALRFGRGVDCLQTARADAHRQRVEIRLGTDFQAELLQARRQRAGQAVDAPRDGLQAFRPVVNGVHRLAMTASKTCAVQMLLVALSRRMCCSRVWRLRR